MGRQRAVEGSRARLPELRLPSAVRPGRNPGFGKFYTWTDTSNTAPHPRFPARRRQARHMTRSCSNGRPRTPRRRRTTAAPREFLRVEQPFANHNGGHIALQPARAPGSADFGLLYVGIADGGSGGDPLGARAEPRLAVRQDPADRSTRSNSANGKYGIPAAILREHGKPARSAKSTSTASATRSVSAGIPERRPVHGRHRPGHRRGAEPRRRRAQPRLEQVGRELRVRQPPAGRPHEAPQRSQR